MGTREIKVCAIQMKTLPGTSKEEKVEYVLPLIEKAAKEGCKIIMPPELCTSDYEKFYVKDPALFEEAEPIPGPTTDAVGQVAKKYGVYVVFPMFEQKAPGIYYNAAALIGPDGTHSSDPLMLYGETEPGKFPNPLGGPGALRAMGEHKGSGLAFMCEILGGALTGSGCAGPPPRKFANGMLSIYMKGDLFNSGGFADEVREYVDFFRSARPETADGRVLIPGDAEREARSRRLVEGISFSAEELESILAAGRSMGLDQAAIDAILAG